MVEENEEIVLHAHPEIGYMFSQWDDGSKDNPRIVTISDNSIYIAQFAQIPTSKLSEVTIATNRCDKPIKIKCATNEVITVVIHPQEGYVFSHWSDDNKDTIRNIIVEQDITLMAYFEVEKKHAVNINLCGNHQQSFVITDGSKIALHAHPDLGYAFTQWSDGNTDNPRVITVTQDADYQAQFVALPTTLYTITTYSNEEGATPTTMDFEEGAEVSLHAHPKTGFVFQQWSDGNTDNPRMVTINADATYVAEFVESGETTPSSTYHFTVKAEDCQQAFVRDMEPSTQITLYAHPEEGNAFIAWSDGNTDNPRTITLEQNTNLVATFTSDESEETHIRDVQAEYFGTICLPYGSTNYTGADFYEVAYMDGLLLFLDKVSTLEAGMPYIYYAYADQIQVYSDGTHADMPSSHNGLYGTFTDITAASNYLQGKYIIHENTVRLCGNNCSLPAYRAYVILDEVSSREPALRPGAQRICMAIRGNNTTTSLDNITEETHISPSQKGIYDVLGRRLDQPTSSGFYIINGEKVILVK
jgi:hypothetical protein